MSWLAGRVRGGAIHAVARWNRPGHWFRATLTRTTGDTTDRPHPYRTRLTNLLWRQRYARGPIDVVGPLEELLRTGNDDQPTITRPYLPKPKRMQDSYCEVILPFAQDLYLREEYVNVFRGLRLGKILEDLDALAASIAYQHCHDGRPGPLPLTIVTASLDRMDLLNVLRPDLDLKLYGHCTHVGRSSLEVTIKVESLGDPHSSDPIVEHVVARDGQGLDWTPILLAKFTLVARDPVTHQSVAVAPLIIETELESKLNSMGVGTIRDVGVQCAMHAYDCVASKQHKLQAAKLDLTKAPPTVEERILLHNLWMEQMQYEDGRGNLVPERVPDTVAFPEQTRQQIVKLCHPQERNIHSSIFGGFLMHEAFELGYLVATLYVGGRPYTIALDDVAFKRPVPIGSILQLSSQVEYAEGEPHGTFQVSVTAEVIRDVRIGRKEITNVFFFTFSRAKHVNSGGENHLVRRLLPRSYAEGMAWLQGKRRKERGVEFKRTQLEEFKTLPLIVPGRKPDLPSLFN